MKKRTAEAGVGGAELAYMENVAKGRRQLAELDKALKAHGRRQSRATADWGYAGDMAHVSDTLGEVLQFVGGGRA